MKKSSTSNVPYITERRRVPVEQIDETKIPKLTKEVSESSILFRQEIIRKWSGDKDYEYTGISSFEPIRAYTSIALEIFKSHFDMNSFRDYYEIRLTCCSRRICSDMLFMGCILAYMEDFCKKDTPRQI